MDGRLAAGIPAPWRTALAPVTGAADFAALERFVAAERAEHAVFPPPHQVFAALEACPPAKVRVVVVGQDPYHDHGQAHGLSFSVAKGVKPPPSLRNILAELVRDVGVPPPAHGDLRCWARQGVLLLNAVLTVRAHQAGSHRRRGWEAFTDGVLGVLADGPPKVFVLWGADAQKKTPLIPRPPHVVVAGVHPSPLSAHRGFVGSRPFTAINGALEQLGQPPVAWALS